MKKQTDDMRGFDSRFTFDYMGSSEFEFGALPQSLKRICQKRNTHILLPVRANKKISQCKDLHVFGDKTAVEEYVKFIPDLLKNKLYTKEWTGIPESLGIIKDGLCHDLKSRFDAWWDIDNDVILCRSLDVGVIVNKAIGEVIEKKKSQGATDWLPVSDGQG
jgi:hypothetical protein